MIENHAHHRHNNFYDPTTKLRNCEKNPMFIVYSMQGCGYCDKVHQLMHLTKQPYVVYTLDEHFTIDEFEAEFSTKHFPQVIHDHADGRKHIGGAAEVAASEEVGTRHGARRCGQRGGGTRGIFGGGG